MTGQGEHVIAAEPAQGPGVLVDRILEVIRDDVLPAMGEGVELGNKVFGAAILAKSDLSLVCVGVNEETRSPLLHGEISCLSRFWDIADGERPPPEECLFVTTHEPCSLCLSGITWSGFDNFYYLFSYEDTRDEFEIPHDLNILAEVFGCEDGGYASTNAYWSSHSIPGLIESVDDSIKASRLALVEELRRRCAALSERYQAGKGTPRIPLG